MNYLRLITGFYARLEICPLSARSQALWHTLVWHCNKARWQQPIQLHELVLRGELSLTHKQFLAARSELIEGGYIEHIIHQGRTPASYNIIDLGV